MRIHGFIGIILATFLVSCSGLPLSGEQNSNLTLIEKDAFNVSVPKNWAPAQKQDLPTPKNGSISLAYISSDVVNGFSNNFIVLSEKLDGIINSKKYSEINNIQTTKNYLEYTKILESDITFPDSDEGKTYGFEARYNQTTPRKKFLQTAKVCGNTVHLLTITLSLDKKLDPYIPILESFTCKK